MLIDPVAATRWAPVDFEVDGAGDRLRVGTPTRVSGRLAGRDVGFTVEVHHADADRLALTADGPVGLDVAYDFAAVDGERGCRASVSVPLRRRPRWPHLRPGPARRAAVRRRAPARRPRGSPARPRPADRPLPAPRGTELTTTLAHRPRPTQPSRQPPSH